MYPDLDTYHTKDLWKAVPGREGYWATAGRVDDFVKLASLTKFNAIEIEQIINRDPRIAACIVGGDAQQKPFVLVQLLDDSSRPNSTNLDDIWPSLAEANKHVFSEAQLWRDLVLFTTPDRPIKKTAKGTVDRRNTIQMYNREVEELYAAAGL
jgi:acyl-coenzyme A synthetase/AMP-(fatty) acid ligase